MIAADALCQLGNFKEKLLRRMSLKGRPFLKRVRDYLGALQFVAVVKTQIPTVHSKKRPRAGC